MTVKLPLKLTKKAKKRLAKLKRTRLAKLRATLTVTATDTAGNHSKLTARQIRLKR